MARGDGHAPSASTATSDALHYINAQPTLGSITAHNFISARRRKLMVANYGMGEGGPDRSVVVYGIREDGGLTPPLASVAHSGTGPNAERQERSHAHSVNETIGGGIVIVADLGIDRLIAYRLSDAGELEQLARVRDGAGRRPAPCGAPSGRPPALRHERTGFVGRLAVARPAIG